CAPRRRSATSCRTRRSRTGAHRLPGRGTNERPTTTSRREGRSPMAQLVRELMTPQPVALPGDTPVRDAARRMRDDDIGNVLVSDGENVRGIVTDRDLVVRGLADHDD